MFILMQVSHFIELCLRAAKNTWGTIYNLILALTPAPKAILFPRRQVSNVLYNFNPFLYITISVLYKITNHYPSYCGRLFDFLFHFHNFYGCRGPLDKNHAIEGESGDHWRRRCDGRVAHLFTCYWISFPASLVLLSKNCFLISIP